MITRDPLFRPADAEVPPRLRPMFSDKRRVVLPGVIQSRYERAKTAFEKSDYKAAADGFTQVLVALSDPDIAREASRAPLADRRVLSIGFKSAVRAMTQRQLNPLAVFHRRHARPRSALARIASARNVVRPSPYLSMLCLKRSSLSYIDTSPLCMVRLHG